MLRYATKQDPTTYPVTAGPPSPPAAPDAVVVVNAPVAAPIILRGESFTGSEPNLLRNFELDEMSYV